MKRGTPRVVRSAVLPMGVASSSAWKRKAGDRERIIVLLARAVGEIHVELPLEELKARAVIPPRGDRRLDDAALEQRMGFGWIEPVGVVWRRAHPTEHVHPSADRRGVHLATEHRGIKIVWKPIQRVARIADPPGRRGQVIAGVFAAPDRVGRDFGLLAVPSAHSRFTRRPHGDGARADRGRRLRDVATRVDRALRGGSRRAVGELITVSGTMGGAGRARPRHRKTTARTSRGGAYHGNPFSFARRLLRPARATGRASVRTLAISSGWSGFEPLSQNS